MAKGKKTEPETVFKIMSVWAVTDNYHETARRLGMAESSVRQVVAKNRDKPEFVRLCAEKREDFSKAADRIIRKALRRLEDELDNAETEIPVNCLTTVIGVLYDKKALADGASTERVTVEVKLPPGVDEYAE